MQDPGSLTSINAKRRERLNTLCALGSALVCLLIPLSAILGSQSHFGKISDFPEYYAAAKMIC
ncbi:MAG: hypothetical protein K2X27_20465, partial [Candidatus Obscuribacterales bacterium]|nr:hypothetical protein [Candidatus Obscuribacterales bacterium]